MKSSTKVRRSSQIQESEENKPATPYFGLLDAAGHLELADCGRAPHDSRMQKAALSGVSARGHIQPVDGKIKL